MTETRITRATQSNSTLNRYLELLIDDEWHTLEDMTRQLKSRESFVHGISDLYNSFGFVEYDVVNRKVKIDSATLDLYLND